jgi:NitT/TauT family transport system ATP-binding protein
MSVSLRQTFARERLEYSGSVNARDAVQQLFSRAAMPMPQIQVSKLRKEFGRGARRMVALDGVDYTVERGSFVSLCGPSGCGKSTLLNLILGLDRPSSGEVRINGEVVYAPGRSIGTVFQDANLMPWRTVLSNVLYPAQLRSLPIKQYRDRAIQLLELTGLSRFATHYPSELSGGMRQRVAICRALILDPDVLLMDEPFSALDALTRDEMSIELQRIWSLQAKTVVVTHSIREAVFLSDRVVVMGISPGRITEEFQIDLDRPRTAQVETISRFNVLIHDIRESIARGRTGLDHAS